MVSASVHPLLEGVQNVSEQYRALPERSGLFEELYTIINANWHRYREPDRWPTSANWVLRVAPGSTEHQTQHFEKQLQKRIAICLENEGWGNDVPTASGLVDHGGRQMNVDLAHRVDGGFEFIELKIQSNTPYDAAVQILRYGAVYMLYRLEPELVRRFRMNSMICAKRIVLEVLAPNSYYSCEALDLRSLETQLNHGLEMFGKRRDARVALSFRFMAFAPGFTYQPKMACGLICDAVRHRVSPFLQNT
jgi:hypothetical protein